MKPSSASAEPLPLFLADDHKIIRDGLKALIEKAGGFRLVGEAADGRALVEKVLTLQPALVVTDLAMSELNGIEATRQLRAAGFGGIIIMLSMHDERRYVSEALAAGVNGYVHKDHAFEQILAAITAARTGEIWLSPQLQRLAGDGRLSPLSELLSTREREVMQLFAEGHGTKEIAALLHLSPKTVEAHRLNLFAKLGVNNVIELTHIAIKEGIVHL